MNVNCPSCGTEIEIDPSYTKSFVQSCISCGNDFKVQIGEDSQPEPSPSPNKPDTHEGWVCLKCEVVGKPKKKGGGGKIVAIGWFIILPLAIGLSSILDYVDTFPVVGSILGVILAGIGLVAALYGLIGSLIHGLIVGFGSTVHSCYNCGYDEIIPLRSPKGEEIARKHGWL